MADKTERITFLASTSFKKQLFKEAENTGVSISELIRRRCEDAPKRDKEPLSERMRRIAMMISGMSKEILEREKRLK